MSPIGKDLATAPPLAQTVQEGASSQATGLPRNGPLPAPPDRSGRNEGIDLLRGLLVLGVMAFHYTIRWSPPDFAGDLLHLDHAYSRDWAIGGFGVQVFFMISGYVISMSVLRAGSGWRFAFSRFRRIYPAYAVAAVVAFLIPLWAGPWQLRSSLGDLAATLLLLPNELGFKYTDGAFWTLTVEAKFYFFVFLGYAALRERFWLLLAGVGVIAPIAYRIAPGLGDKVLLAHYIGFFLIGMAAWFGMNERRTMPAIILLAAGLWAHSFAFQTISYDGAVSYFTQALIGLSAMAIFALARFNPRVRVPVLGFLGAVSYELYLLHQVMGISIIGALKEHTGMSDGAAFVLAGVIVILAATILQKVVAPPLRSAIDSIADASRIRYSALRTLATS
ncbi:acyltransferase 3 [Novosphingobium sp. Rr 2-17]|uniref:acyltransferase family protein n=1 Tax=Novosphingobium sp. Rr 2-17 TaxID=555793 RepID=UPI0002699EFD|nr:acyltransferase [Novosphingobium sp. Rr 2-17]EIZ78461.1 acyltransferase 3 [Novosphingobium sp. Rr 2-17]